MTPAGAADRRPPPTGVVGMVHLLPLPGSPRWAGSIQTVLERARGDARALAEGGVDSVLVENFGDLPFYAGPVPAETVASMTAAVAAVVGTVSLPIGVNVLRNDAAAALAIAAATGARFIRVNVHVGGMYTDQGWIEGAAAATVRLRDRLAPGVAILADVMVKHATPPPGLDLERAAREAWERGLADALVLSGAGTGEPASLEEVRAVRASLPAAPVLVGSGVTEGTIRATLEIATGAIVGSAFQEGGQAGGAVDPARVRRVLRAAGR
jgi:uncharacterized protein